jgi:predicted amidohydrolase
MDALLAQLAPAPGAASENALRAAALVEEHPDVDLLVLPELFLNGYDLDTARAGAIDPAGAELGVIRDAAQRAGTAVVVGFAERRGTEVANSAACVGAEGEVEAIYRKTHLFGREADVFSAGDELVTVRLAHCTLGVLICFDMEFPEPARALARAGAETLVTIAANMEPFFSDHRIASQARALDNRLPHLYVNRCGQEGGLRFVGGTRALRADGTIVAESPPGEGTLAIEVEHPERADAALDYLAQVREGLRVSAPAPSSTRGDSR